MKKLLALLLTLIVATVACISLVGCGNNDENGNTVAIYMPDGAPALAFSKLMHEKDDLGYGATYTVVNADAIGSYVANGSASVALLPVNAASKLCTNGDNYKMVASVTHGNLFVIGKGSATTLEELKGETVAVVNLPNVPGLTFKALLSDAGIAYTDNDAEKNANNVLLKPIDGTAVVASLSQYDYVVAPQPAASTAVGKVTGTSIKMSLQTLWGEGGYPQAVLVVKSSLVKDNAFVTKLLSALSENSTEWIVTNATNAVQAINDNFVEGGTSTLKAPVLTTEVVNGCNISVKIASAEKSAVIDYLTKIRTVNPQAGNIVSDNFFA